MPEVSIVLPTYNGAHYLRESIESCLDQSYSDIELIVVDDCSTDGTSDILRCYADDPRVKVLRHAENAKLPTALNTGFANSSGAYLTWTSDDNRFAPRAIDQMVHYLEEHSDVGFVYTDYWLTNEADQVVRRVRAGPPEHLRERCAITCFLYRRVVREVIGDYDPELFRIEDYDYWLRVAQQFTLAWYPEPLYYYRRHAASLTCTDPLPNRARMFDKVQTKFFGPDPRRRSRVLGQWYMAEAFERHLRQDRLGVLRNASRAVRHDLSHFRNRGLLSIILQALVGRTAVRDIKRLSTRG